MDDCNCDKGKLKWLSQEAEEEDKMIKNVSSDYEKSEMIQMTKEAYKDILARLDTLEQCNRIAEVDEYIKEELKEKTKDIVKDKNMRPMTQEDAKELVDKIGRCAEEVRQMNKTADEMFRELGYEKLEDGCSYKKDNEVICISKQGDKYLKTLDRFIGGAVLNFISEDEDKAIHRKIEELKK